MKRVYFVALLAVISTVALVTAAELSDLEALVDFDTDLISLARMNPAERAAMVEDDRFLLLEGVTSSYLNGEDGTVVELVEAEWQGTEEVFLYRLRTIFNGVAWAERFPERPPREPAEGYVPLNSRILIVARFLPETAPDGTPVLEGLRILAVR